MQKALAFADFMAVDKGKETVKTPDHPISLFEGLAGKEQYCACENSYHS